MTEVTCSGERYEAQKHVVYMQMLSDQCWIGLSNVNTESDVVEMHSEIMSYRNRKRLISYF